MKTVRIMTLQIEVTVPIATGENEVEQAINAVLDEQPGVDWEDWTVGAATIVNVRRARVEDDDRDSYSDDQDRDSYTVSD